MDCIAIQSLCRDMAQAGCAGGVALARRRWAGSRRARKARATRRRSEGNAVRALGARPGRAVGLWAVHLVHSACF